jgi:hypothetical protein
MLQNMFKGKVRHGKGGDILTRNANAVRATKARQTAGLFVLASAAQLVVFGYGAR